jgi:hypothetical protein
MAEALAKKVKNTGMKELITFIQYPAPEDRESRDARK